MATVVDGLYEWDSEKAASNLAKHGVSFPEAIVALEDVNAVEGADDRDPSRNITIGAHTTKGVLLVVSTEMTDRTRVISAPPATSDEIRTYRNNQP
jgi:uncharacterized DUF497 family protein